jgi:hypothetical protein
MGWLEVGIDRLRGLALSCQSLRRAWLLALGLFVLKDEITAQGSALGAFQLRPYRCANGLGISHTKPEGLGNEEIPDDGGWREFHEPGRRRALGEGLG